MITELTVAQRRQRVLEIANSQSASPAAKFLADAAMDLIERRLKGFVSFLSAKPLEPLDYEPPQPNDVSVSHLRAMIMPAGYGCNLRCKYCFNAPSGPVEIMSKDVLEAIIVQIIEVLPKSAKFIFHGGEPLLAGIDFYKTVIALQEKYSRPEQSISNAIQTNGTLLNEEWGRFFAKNKFSVGVSIDGPQEIHDSKRVDSAGHGTLSRVIKGVRAVQEHGVNVSAIAVITCPSDVSPQQLLDFSDSLGISSLRVNSCCDPELSQCYGEYMETLFDIWVNSRHNRNSSVIMAILRGSLGYNPGTCKWSNQCSYYMGFLPDGSVKPCCERYIDAKFSFGNIMEDSLVNILKGPRAQSFWDSRKEGDSYCDGCKWWDMCNGGCSHARIESAGSLVAKDPMCAVYMDTFQRLTSRIDQILMEGVSAA